MKKKIKEIYDFIKPFRIEDGKLITGAKNPKKTINIVLQPYHLYFAGFIFMILSILLFSGIYTNPYIEYKLVYQCPNGSVDVYDDDKDYYCGVHKDDIEDYNNNLVDDYDYINLTMIGIKENETVE